VLVDTRDDEKELLILQENGPETKVGYWRAAACSTKGDGEVANSSLTARLSGKVLASTMKNDQKRDLLPGDEAAVGDCSGSGD
jgi:hypothetical protein